MAMIIPALTYDDPRAAIALLRDAFGFEEHAVHADDAGDVQHAELRLGDAYIMLGPTRGPDRDPLPAGPTTIYVVVDDADALHERAAAAGAEIVEAPTDRDYGSREFAAVDAAGNWWSFGTYAPGP